jgi:hypothetical protein
VAKAERAEEIMNINRSNHGSQSSPPAEAPAGPADRSTLSEEGFLRAISLERKRAERSRQPALLMLIEMEAQFPSERHGPALEKILSALAAATRETDVTGWYKHDRVVGMLFTEIAVEEGASIASNVMTRVSEALRSHLNPRQFNQVVIALHLFPEKDGNPVPALPGNSPLYPELTAAEAERLVQR